MTEGPLPDPDRLAADLFALSYREYLLLKPSHYRWSVLAPRAVAALANAHDQNWSHEKIADFLNCGVEEAAQSLRRYQVSRKVNSESSEAARLRAALVAWVESQPGMEDLGEGEKRRRAGELALMVANHLYAAARAGEDLMKLSKDLEGAEASPEQGKGAPRRAEEPPKWGPQWKD